MKKIKMGIFFILVVLSTQLVYAQVLNEDEILKIAKERFDEAVPLDYKDEYRFLGVTKYAADPSKYYVLWGRYVNNIPVENDKFSLRIDANTGQILKQSLDYTHPASELDTRPSITKDQIKWFAGKYGDVNKTTLFIRDKGLYWYVEFDSGHFSEFNAGTGKFVSGSTTTENFQFDASEYYLYKLRLYSPFLGVLLFVVVFIF